MPNILDNVDLEKVAKTVEDGKKDKVTLCKPIKLQGEWILERARRTQRGPKLRWMLRPRSRETVFGFKPRLRPNMDTHTSLRASMCGGWQAVARETRRLSPIKNV
jgi:hypothetical protein